MFGKSINEVVWYETKRIANPWLRGRWIFGAGTVISGFQGYNAISNGDYGGATKSGLDIGMGAYATFGGPTGWIIGGGYFALDAFGAFNRPIIPRPYVSFIPMTTAVPDNTYVEPPIILPFP